MSDWTAIPKVTFTREAPGESADLSEHYTGDAAALGSTKLNALNAQGVRWDGVRYVYDGTAGPATTIDEVQLVARQTLFTFKLVSEVTGRLPFTIGQPFKRGDVPDGTGIVADCADFQADIRNRWEDGSVKFAVLSGLADLTAGAQHPVTVAVGAAEQAAGFPESALLTALGANDVSVKLSNVRDNRGAILLADVTCSLRACVSKTAVFGALAAHTSGLVRAFAGPVMSEFHYYAKTGEAQLAVWFYVRLYKDNRIEVELVVENGWLYAPSPGDRRYGVTVTVAGATVFTHEFNDLIAKVQQRQFHHSRWRRVYWVGEDPKVTPQHDGEYIQSTELVPNYGKDGISRSALTSNMKSNQAFTGLLTRDGALRPPDPQHRSMMYANMNAPSGGPGYLGLAPRFQVAYLMDSTYAEGYWACEADLHGYGIKSIWYRDETTGWFASTATYPKGGYSNVIHNTSYGYPPGNTPDPVAQSSGHTFDSAHNYPVGYASYLITGRWSHFETVLATATFCAFTLHQSRRLGGEFLCKDLAMRVRAWTLRSWGQALLLYPDAMRTDTAFAGLQKVMENNLIWGAANIACPNLGVAYITQLATDEGYHMHGKKDPVYRYDAPWMNHYLCITYSHLRAAGLPVSEAALTALRTLIDVSHKGVVGMAVPGRIASGFNWRMVGAYTLPYTKFTGEESCATWKELYEIYVKTPTLNPHEFYLVTLNDPDADGLALRSSAGNPAARVEASTGNPYPGTVWNSERQIWEHVAWFYYTTRMNSPADFGTHHVDAYLSALAYAVDDDYPNALEAYERVTSASNYQPMTTRVEPEFMIIPRYLP